MLKYLQAYPANVQAQVAQLLQDGLLGARLQRKYQGTHTVRTDRALYSYVMDLKTRYLRTAEPVSKVAYDSKLQVITHALGTHTSISRVQGSKLKSKREIRIASLFKEAPLAFLRMISVHELAHLKEKAHDGFALGPDQPDVEPLQHAHVSQRQCGVQAGLPAHGGKDGVGALFLDDLGDDFGVISSI